MPKLIYNIRMDDIASTYLANCVAEGKLSAEQVKCFGKRKGIKSNKKIAE